MSLFERIQKKIIIESSSDTTGQNKGNKNRKKQFSSNISRTVDPSNVKQGELLNPETTPVGTEDTPISTKKKRGRKIGSKNKQPETNPNKQLSLDDIKKKRTPRKGVDYFFDPEEAKRDREKLISKRKEYGIDRKGNMSDAGAERYARKTKQLSSGSNIPVKITQADKDLAKRRAVGGDKITDKSGKIIGTTTGKYGGNLPRKRPSNAKSLEQIQKEIDSRPPDGRTKPKLIKTKVTDKELQDVLKTGRKTKPGRTKRITVGSLDARDKAIKDLDDLIIEPKEGDVKQTEKLIKRQRKRVVKRITTPKPGEIEQQQKILTQTQNKPATKIGGKSFDDLIKDARRKNKAISQDIAKLKTKSFVPPKTTPKLDPITEPLKRTRTIKKIKIKAPPKTQTGTFKKIMKFAGKNRNPILKGLAYTAGGAYLLSRLGKTDNAPKNNKSLVGGTSNYITKIKPVDATFTLAGKGGDGYRPAGMKK